MCPGDHCAICLENISLEDSKPTVTTSCKHSFHLPCILQYAIYKGAQPTENLNRQVELECPLCRNALIQEQDIAITLPRGNFEIDNPQGNMNTLDPRIDLEHINTYEELDRNSRLFINCSNMIEPGLKVAVAVWFVIFFFFIMNSEK